MVANASIIIHALKLRLHWSTGLGLLQCGAAWGTGGKCLFKANRNSGKAAREGGARVVVFFKLKSLICSLSPRFLSMHCCYRFSEGEKMHHVCRSKVCWILNTAELWGRSGKKLLQVFFEQNRIASVSLFERRHASGFSGVFGGEIRNVDLDVQVLQISAEVLTCGGALCSQRLLPFSCNQMW